MTEAEIAEQHRRDRESSDRFNQAVERRLLAERAMRLPLPDPVEIEQMRLAHTRASMPPKSAPKLDTMPTMAVDREVLFDDLVVTMSDLLTTVAALAKRVAKLEDDDDTVLRWNDLRGERAPFDGPKSSPAWPGVLLSQPIITRRSP